MPTSPSRRQFVATATGLFAASAFTDLACADENESSKSFSLKYILASCMYGYSDLDAILAEVKRTGSVAIDLWPKVHGNQREQLDQIGEPAFESLLAQHNTSLGCITQYKLGPFGLADEMRLAKRLGCKLIVTGSSGPSGLSGSELKSAMAGFVEKMKPHLAVAEETGVTIAIENHGNQMLESADGMKWLAELLPSPNLAIAFAPYHLDQDADFLAKLITDLGPSIAMFYAWQHGMGCTKKLPKDQELLQMPGRGDLDFRPLVGALRQIQYRGWTEIFMHPVPRGVPILVSTDAVSAEINRARRHLQTLV
ncbi:Xylose isomerase-like TIM barrel [Rubripirellula lacrimiformis]|uniref:Xylose isomerase-like TIM barrel n=1 Tax=Rubripirellula lacrimiformis TaxID=1930273 RepID=A0A517N3Y5_9BACT|nr:sugar phosphate isomerase/epimerase [Rubripirellula lacrimiformis]QDT01853.1 Xylose isomerase-like TIM barrel [Rubripirellula lacrimiformis]